MGHPTTIEKRQFTCTSCGYSAQVYGDMYWDHGCHNFMATFMCRNCKVLFENLISKIKAHEIKFEAYHDLADDFTCLQCGSQSSKVWNKEIDKCPKCKKEMKYEVIGTLKLRWD